MDFQTFETKTTKLEEVRGVYLVSVTNTPASKKRGMLELKDEAGTVTEVTFTGKQHAELLAAEQEAAKRTLRLAVKIDNADTKAGFAIVFGGVK